MLLPFCTRNLGAAVAEVPHTWRETMLSRTTTYPHAEVTIQFEGLTAAQVAAVHKAVEEAKTEARTRAGVTTPFVTIRRSEMKNGGMYTTLLDITTMLLGDVDGVYAHVQPSRKALGPIFDAATVLPAEETVIPRKDAD